MKKKRQGEEIEQHTYVHIRDSLVEAFVKYSNEKHVFETKLQQDDINRRALNGLATIREEPVTDVDTDIEGEDQVSHNQPALSASEKAYARIMCTQAELEIPGLDHEEANPLSLFEVQSNQLKNEIVRYIRCEIDNGTKFLSLKSNPFDWWETNSHQFPLLAIMARKILSPPGASIASERLFSCSKMVMNDLRHSLNTSHMEKLTFLAANLKIVEAKEPLKIDYNSLTL